MVSSITTLGSVYRSPQPIDRSLLCVSPFLKSSSIVAAAGQMIFRSAQSSGVFSVSPPAAPLLLWRPGLCLIPWIPQLGLAARLGSIFPAFSALPAAVTPCSLLVLLLLVRFSPVLAIGNHSTIGFKTCH